MHWRRPTEEIRGRIDHGPILVAIIDGPYDDAVLSRILAQKPIGLGNERCGINPNTACSHGTFIMGLLGARRDALLPGMCPDCSFLHIPLFIDEIAPSATVDELAKALRSAVTAGARLINLSLAILGDDLKIDHQLALALNEAEESGAIVVVAAGNQGRLAMGQLLAHPATVPVVAVDGASRLLSGCNFGPTISRRGIAAFGHRIVGYAPMGGTSVMSGTSVATAIATGILASVWSERPAATAADIRAAIAKLAPRDESRPPILNRGTLLALLDETRAAVSAMGEQPTVHRSNRVRLQGDTTMNDAGIASALNRTGLPGVAGGTVIPAHATSGCSCGALGGACTCANGQSSPLSFVYALGSIDVLFPDQSISEELQSVARTRGIEMGANESLRSWYARVLAEPGARYVARQVSWVLRIEGIPAYYLTLQDLHDLDDLIGCLRDPTDDLELAVGLSSLIRTEVSPGVRAPVLNVDQLASFNRNDIIAWFNTSSGAKRRRGDSDPSELFNELFKDLFQSADNFGQTDQWRALNFLAVRYPPLHRQLAKMAESGHEFKGFDVNISRLAEGNEKRIVDPVFSFQHKETGVVQKYFVRLDMTHLFPMLVHHLAKYKDHSIRT
jgi:hypothetical protein